MMEAPQSYAPPSNSGTEEGSPSSLGSSASGSAMHLAAAGEPYDDHSGSYPSNHHKQHHPDFSNNSPSAGSGSFSNASPAASPRSPSQKFQALRMVCLLFLLVLRLLDLSSTHTDTHFLSSLPSLSQQLRSLRPKKHTVDGHAGELPKH